MIGLESGLQKILKPINAVRKALGQEQVTVDFSSKLVGMDKPTWKDEEIIKRVDIKKYSDDDIMAQIDKSRQRKQTDKTDQLIKSLDANTKAIGLNVDALDDNTGALRVGSSDLTGEEIADRLLPRLERVIYG